MPDEPRKKRPASATRGLKRGGNPAPKGNRYRQTHGALARVVAEEAEPQERRIYAVLAEEDPDPERRETFARLAADAPLRAADGALPAHDRYAVSMLAECLVRLGRVRRDLDDHGWRDRKTGEPRPAAEYERKLRAEARDWLREMGMTPAARGRLGLDLARTVDASSAWSEPDPELRRDLLRQAGLLGEAGDA